MVDVGPHNRECATATSAECFCECHGRSHGVAHVGSLAGLKMRKGVLQHEPDAVNIHPAKNAHGKVTHYVVTKPDGKSPGGKPPESKAVAALVAHGPDVQVTESKSAHKPMYGLEGVAHRGKIPDNPLQALLDKDRSFKYEYALEHLYYGDGDDHERLLLHNAVQKFREMALKGNGYSSPDYGALYDLSSELRYHAGGDRAVMRKLVDDAWGKLTTDEGRAAALWQLWTTQRRHDKAPVGMPGGPWFTSNEQATEYANERLRPPELTGGERSGLKRYTGSWYTEINDGLRGKSEMSPSAKEVSKQVDSAIAKSQLPQPLILKRSEGYTFLRSMGADPDDPSSWGSLVGKVGVDKGFLSTSIGQTPAFEGKKVEWVIKAPAGTPGLYVDHPLNTLTSNSGEREVLLARNTHRVIHAVYKHPDPHIHTIYIEAELVPEGWTPPADWRPEPMGNGWRSSTAF